VNGTSAPETASPGAFSERRSNDGRSPPAETRGLAAGVTAVVVTHNSARHVAALGKALSTGSLVPTRMLVVDNGSVDDTVAKARLAGFEVIETGGNDGFGAGCNAGVRAASTEFVLLCNPDVRPARDALERLAAALTTNVTAAIAGPSLGEEPKARRFSRITANVAGFLPQRLQPWTERFGQHVPVDGGKDQILVDYAEGAFILCRVAALQSVGGFDERFFLYCEEEDLSRRLGERGWRTLLVPSATAAHAGSTSSEGVDKASMAPFRVHSLYWYYRRHHSRVYAEIARGAMALCVTLDRRYRAVVGRPQLYGPGTATAPFRTMSSIRRDHEGAS
jgi:N-acetylglucosaminyl-diphospho-decaprenol L-rhamnosyltransferase